MVRKMPLLLALVTAASWASWGCRESPPEAGPRARSDRGGTTTRDAAAAGGRFVLSELAQKNLKLTARPLVADVFWKTTTIPGMIVDRPGSSDREVVAPTVGRVSRLLRLPGDIVQPGDGLISLTLASESLQQTQAEYFKTRQDVTLAEAKRGRLLDVGEGVPGARIIEVETEIARLEAASRGLRQELLSRGLSEEEVARVALGQLSTEITLRAPGRATSEPPGEAADALSQAYELQQLEVELGEEVRAGQTLCRLSNHLRLSVEGRAFRDETVFLERSIEENWPVEVDFQEDVRATWPAAQSELFIRYLSNTIDPATRTFTFQLPLDNQYKLIEHDGRRQLLWRFRPGQKVLLKIRVERLEDVFAVPADAVAVDGAEAFVFTQNVDTFERTPVHVVHRDRQQAVIAADGSLPDYVRDGTRRTIPAVVLGAAMQLNRIAKSQVVGDVPPGYHVHADGSLHKHEEDAK